MLPRGDMHQYYTNRIVDGEIPQQRSVHSPLSNVIKCSGLGWCCDVPYSTRQATRCKTGFPLRTRWGVSPSEARSRRTATGTSACRSPSSACPSSTPCSSPSWKRTLRQAGSRILPRRGNLLRTEVLFRLGSLLAFLWRAHRRGHSQCECNIAYPRLFSLLLARRRGCCCTTWSQRPSGR